MFHLRRPPCQSVMCYFSLLSDYVSSFNVSASRYLKFTTSVGDENCCECVLNGYMAPCNKIGFGL